MDTKMAKEHKGYVGNVSAGNELKPICNVME